MGLVRVTQGCTEITENSISYLLGILASRLVSVNEQVNGGTFPPAG